MKAKDEGRLVEVFGTGTAAIVSQVGNIFYNGAMHSIPNSTEESQVSMRYGLVEILFPSSQEFN